VVLNYEACRAALEKLRDWYRSSGGESHRNEATTRLHLIDRLLFECLGWERSDCICEERYDRQYSDYSLSCPSRSLIVEAKKEGVYFELPAGHTSLECSLKTLCDDKQIANALRQAMGYCQERGTPLGAVCSGHQMICFVASRSDGTPPLDGNAIVFASLERMAEEFRTLWQFLSKPGVQEARLLNHLLGTEIPNLPPKLSASILPYPGTKGRNILQTDLQLLGELVIEDVVRAREVETEFIKECFCSSGALSQYALVSKSILKQRYAALFEDGDEGPTLVSAMTQRGIELTEQTFAESLSKRPILLLGDVGVGKTIFLRYLIRVEGADVMANAIPLYVDLGSTVTSATGLLDCVLSEMERQLLEDYGVDIRERNLVHGVYHMELTRFSTGVYGDLRTSDPSLYRQKEIEFLEDKIKDRKNHVRQCLVHLSRGRKKQVILFIDNADQRDQQVQEQAFLIAQEVSANWPVAVFVAIRPETFHRSKRSGALSGYHPKAFTISPPRVDEVLKKRLLFALKVAEGRVRLAPPLSANMSETLSPE